MTLGMWRLQDLIAALMPAFKCQEKSIRSVIPLLVLVTYNFWSD